MNERYGNEAYSRAVRQAENEHGIYETASDGRDGTEGTVWADAEMLAAIEEREARFWRIKPSDILTAVACLAFWPLVWIDPMLGLGYTAGLGAGMLLALYQAIEGWHNAKGE